MTDVDLRDVDPDLETEFRVVTESGEEFVGTIVAESEHPHDNYSKGYVDYTFEGVEWEQVQERVSQSVLHLKQDFARSTGRPQDAVVYGYEERDDIADPFVDVELGTIASIEEVDE